MQEHLSSEHNYEVSVSAHEFKSMAEFEEWKIYKGCYNKFLINFFQRMFHYSPNYCEGRKVGNLSTINYRHQQHHHIMMIYTYETII